jgi:hypothetical protein
MHHYRHGCSEPYGLFGHGRPDKRRRVCLEMGGELLLEYNYSYESGMDIRGGNHMIPADPLCERAAGKKQFV